MLSGSVDPMAELAPFLEEPLADEGEGASASFEPHLRLWLTDVVDVLGSTRAAVKQDIAAGKMPSARRENEHRWSVRVCCVEAAMDGRVCGCTVIA